MKWCGTCKTMKTKSEFAKAIGQVDGLQGFCRSCGRVKQAKWRSENRVQANRAAANAHRRRRLGIEPHQYDEMLAEQGGVCAICNGLCDIRTVTGVQKNLAVDHDHETGDIRGLLCTRCNTAIGLFDDDTERLAKAREYLFKYPTKFAYG
jgi:hypothetical protein